MRIGLGADDCTLQALDLRLTGKRGGLGALRPGQCLLGRSLGRGEGLGRLLGLFFESFNLEGRFRPGVIGPIDEFPGIGFDELDLAGRLALYGGVDLGDGPLTDLDEIRWDLTDLGGVRLALRQHRG